MGPLLAGGSGPGGDQWREDGTRSQRRRREGYCHKDKKGVGAEGGNGAGIGRRVQGGRGHHPRCNADNKDGEEDDDDDDNE